jgi:hypothetical protein
MKTILALSALVLLTGCGQQVDKTGAAPAAAPTEAAQLGPPDASKTPPATYLGRWAPSRDLCAAGPFVFEEKRLSAPGGVICEFERVTPISVGYDVQARCAVDKPDEKTQIKIGLTDGKQMTVNGGPWGETATLIPCAG